MLDDNAREVSSDVAVIVERALDLVEELRGDTGDGHLTTSVFFFVHNTNAGVIDCGDGETQVDVLAGLEQFLEVGAVTARNVSRALEQMAEDERARELVELA